MVRTMRKVVAVFLGIILFLVLCTSLQQCTFDFSGENHQTEPAYMDDQYKIVELPEDSQDVLEYLQQKYGGTFDCIGYNADRTSFRFISEQWDGVLVVQPSLTMLKLGYPQEDFPDKYADNGYLLKIQDSLDDYYTQFLHGWGEIRIFVKLSSTVLPPSIDMNASFVENKSKYPQYFSPELYIVTTEEISLSQVNALKAVLVATDEHVTVSVVHVNEHYYYDNVTINDIVLNPSVYQTRFNFTT